MTDAPPENYRKITPDYLYLSKGLEMHGKGTTSDGIP
jgi:hypothetical protein